MPALLGTLRRLALTPSFAKVGFAKRGFPAGPPDAAEHLQAIPRSVVCGFEWGIETRTQRELEQRLELVDIALRGFAYEGAAMACTIRDAMAGGRGHRTRDLLLGPGQPHIFLTYIGIGFAMSHLPRPLWRNVLPDLAGSAFYPTMSWFAVDGYGFDLAYFATRRWVDRQRTPKPYAWDGSPDYFPRAVDFGIGRALWFIHCGRPDRTVAAVRRFDPRRQADLFSGTGLAAAFAGGCEATELATLLDGAAEHRAEVSLGAVLAVKGRHFSGHVPPATEAAAKVLTGLSVDQAVDLADRTEVPHGEGTPAEPAYELWRRRIREHFTASPGPAGRPGSPQPRS
ncbi:DUF1702 family protein [Catenulispora yoronensis]|uniref:DUF1702 family protein n=1 Tax=Catenulispora yoronensis TaxID=450799 RepID=A0ABP5GCX1_9ACTN